MVLVLSELTQVFPLERVGKPYARVKRDIKMDETDRNF